MELLWWGIKGTIGQPWRFQGGHTQSRAPGEKQPVGEILRKAFSILGTGKARVLQRHQLIWGWLKLSWLWPFWGESAGGEHGQGSALPPLQQCESICRGRVCPEGVGSREDAFLCVLA